MMRRVRERIIRAAAQDYPVLIVGETGTGKDVAANAIHQGSSRSKKAPVVVVAGGLGDTAWSLLFGHRKGAFTGAMGAHPGLFLTAYDSSILFEDISDLPLRLQPMLLRAIEHGYFRALGAEREVFSNARVIASSNCSFQEEISSGRFRSDLFERLSVFRIEMPALRDHLDDLQIYLTHFLKKHSSQTEPPKSISDEALNLLYEYSWPRNVRELEHVLQRASIETEGETVGADVLVDVLAKGVERGPTCRPGRSFLFVDAHTLKRTLATTRWNKREAARRLKISPNTLYRLMEFHGLSRQGELTLDGRLQADSL